MLVIVELGIGILLGSVDVNPVWSCTLSCSCNLLIATIAHIAV